jgi:hypothetical protein
MNGFDASQAMIRGQNIRSPKRTAALSITDMPNWFTSMWRH